MLPHAPIPRKGSGKQQQQEMVIAIKVMKPGKAAGPSEVCAEMICATEVGVSVMVELCQRVLANKCAGTNF